MRPKLFLSHSSDDKPRVRAIKSLLEARGMECWLDEERILVGDSVVEQIAKALKDCDFVVFFISANSIKSGWVKREVNTTLVEQLRAEKTRILPVKLDDVQSPTLLKDFLWADLSDSTSTEGVDLLARSIESHFAECPQETSGDVKEVFDEVERLIDEGPVNSKFHWFLISGLSSAGKDVLAYVLDQRLNLKFGVEQGIKYTTRDRRPSEPNYVREVSRLDFDRLSKDGNIIFRYSKRHESYGFDFAQLKDCVANGIPLISVYTHFTHVPAIVEAMQGHRFSVSPIFIEAPRPDLMRRALFRNLPDDDVAKRVRSIEQDLREINERSTFGSEYKVIKNGDNRAFIDAANELEAFVRSRLARAGNRTA